MTASVQDLQNGHQNSIDEEYDNGKGIYDFEVLVTINLASNSAYYFKIFL